MYTYPSARMLFTKKAILLLLSIGCFNISFTPATIKAAERKPDFIKTEDTLDRALNAYELGYKYYVDNIMEDDLETGFSL